MFYETSCSDALRFGDVVHGYISGTPIVERPVPDLTRIQCSIKFDFLPYYAVMTPCCSIGEGMISLAPLLPLKKDFFQNPYFAQDLTSINRVMEPQNAVNERVWDSFTPEEQERRLLEGRSYACVEYFIYEKHPLLAEYKIGKQNPVTTNYYMIDFRSIYQVQCKSVQNPKDCSLDSKLLELTIPTRNDLRGKLADYFSRTPKEDLIPG